MWLGLMLIERAEADAGDHDAAIVVAYEHDRLFSAGGPIEMAPQLVRLLRQAGRETGALRPPRCGECGEPLDVPPLDELDAACASA